MIPPLHQSSWERMACPECYDLVGIQGVTVPPSLTSDRGSDIHHVMSEYTRWCAEKRVSADWVAFDHLASISGPDAGQILDGMRMNFVVDWNRVYATEKTLALTERLAPTERDEDAAHQGTLDAIYLYSEHEALIEDYKSHPRPFEPTTYQGLLYPFMLFQHMPRLQRITFRLIFVRYVNCVREITWEREQMPAMALQIKRARERQIAMHSGEVDMIAIPGSHCWYCPKAHNFTCSLGELNPETTPGLQDRLRWQVWVDQVSEMNRAVLRNAVDAGRDVSMVDGKGMTRRFAAVEREHLSYPLDRTMLTILDEWGTANRADNPMTWGLEISSTKLKQRLKAKKRTDLRERLEASVVQASTEPVFKIVTEDPEAQPGEVESEDF